MLERGRGRGERKTVRERERERERERAWEVEVRYNQRQRKQAHRQDKQQWTNMRDTKDRQTCIIRDGQAETEIAIQIGTQRDYAKEQAICK